MVNVVQIAPEYTYKRSESMQAKYNSFAPISKVRDSVFGRWKSCYTVLLDVDDPVRC